MSLDIYQHTYSGRIAIGEKVESKTKPGVKFPKKLDYFIFTKLFDPKTKTAPRDLITTGNIKKKYGTDQPKEIEVILIDDHYNEAFFTDYLNYPGTTCNCHGDGTIAIRTDKDGVKSEVKCDYKHCEFRLAKTNQGLVTTCKPTGILTFILPEASVCNGIFKYVTHSNMTIGKINGSLREIYRGTSLKDLRVKLRIQVVSMVVAGQGMQNIPTVELSLAYTQDEFAKLNGGKSFQECIKEREVIIKETLPNAERMQTLSLAAENGEGYDGSLDDKKILQPNVESNGIDDEFRM